MLRPLTQYLMVAMLVTIASLAGCANVQVDPDSGMTMEDPNNGNTEIYRLINDTGGAGMMVAGDASFACVAPGTPAPKLSTADRNRLCPDANAICWHLCLHVPSSAADPWLNNHANSRTDQAFQGIRPSGVKFTQWGDGRLDVERVVVTAPVGGYGTGDVVGAFYTLQSNQENWSLLAAVWQYPDPSKNPPAPLIRGTDLGKGLDLNGSYVLFRVNLDGTQTETTTEIVALDPTCATPANGGWYAKGGTLHPVRAINDPGPGFYPCPTDPRTLGPRTPSGMFKCDGSNADERLWGLAETGLTCM